MWLARLTTIGRTSLQVLAILLVLFALGVSLIRGLLPHIPEVRQEILVYVEKNYGVTLQMEELSAKWQAYGPALTVTNLVLPPQANLPMTLVSEQVNIKLDFWQSLLTLAPQIETVSFDKVRIAIDVDNLSNQATSSTPVTNMDWLYAFLLEQLGHFSVNDVSVQLNSSLHQFRPIFIENLVWLNQGDEHWGEGSLFVDDQASDKESLSLQIALQGNGYKPESIKGDIYIAAAALDIGEWASRHINPSSDLDNISFQGVVNFEAWFSFAQRNIQDGQLIFKPSWLEWDDKRPNTPVSSGISIDVASNTQPDKASDITQNAVAAPSTQRFDIKDGLLTWLNTPQGWQVQSHQLVIESNQQTWPELSLSLAYHNAQLFGQLNKINLNNLAPLLPLIPSVGHDDVLLWRDTNVQGDIGPIKLYKAKDKPWVASASLSQLAWQPFEQVPGLSPIDLHLSWANNTLKAELPEQDYKIDFAGGFNQPLQLTGQALSVSFNLSDMRLTAPNITFYNDDIRLQAALNLHFADNPYMALAANLDITDVTKASYYFPLMAMSPNLVEYLKSGLQAGHIEQANVLWRGAFNRYPYVDFDGVFQAEFNINQAEFKFQPDWPAVKQLDLNAFFENKLMDLTINSGQLGQVAVDGAKVWIPELGAKSLLRVEADLLMDAQAAVQVINASPLKSSVGSTLAVVQVKQDLNTLLDLSIPLFKGEKPLIKGAVYFDNNPVFISHPGVNLTQVNGDLSFENNLVTGKNLQAKLFGQPLQFSFATKEKGRQLALDVDFSGHVDIASLPASFNHPLSDYYQGDFDWAGQLRMMFGDQGYSLRAQAETDLQGVSFSLPAPFAKTVEQPQKLSTNIAGDNKQITVNVKLGNQAEFWGGLGNKDGSALPFYDLMLGRNFKFGDKLSQQDGTIHIDIKQANFSEWLPIISGFTASDADAAVNANANASSAPNLNPSRPLVVSPSTFPTLKQINASISQFNLLAQNFEQLKVIANPVDEVWRFNVTSTQFDGRVDFYKNWREQGLKIVADKLHLSPAVKDSQDAQYSPDTLLDSLPPLAVDVDDFKVFDMQLGHLQMQANPYDQGYRFQTVSLTHPVSNVSLQAKGAWTKNSIGTMTQFDVKLNADKFDDLSTMLGINPGLQDAPLGLVGDFSWQGAPYNFSLETLNGKIKFDMGKGHLSEISDKGARIFSLFSLDSILRKLSFDFSDVFGSGLYFNSFTGNLDIKDGVVQTTDTEMDAVAGNMKVRGYTDLTTQSLNYDIRFMPQLASSVPTVVFLSTSAWTLGIGAFALTKVLEPVIEIISEIRFRLNGTMDNPELQELERKSKEIVIPESILREKGIFPSAKDAAPNDKAAQKPSSTDKANITVPQAPATKDADTKLESDTGDKSLTAPGVNVSNLRYLKRDSYANQFVTVSKQSRRSSQSGFYQRAA
ncbi:YhdP family protein [Shewanella sp. OMA3-2]|uniref:YhdP family protein n=1 Tax=Shewanella sp. OMA3-2 TaxID=2908650 RepID=UPI001F42FD57|nr:YhdP family protein [Shewanella sp. OMA3-2]UJF21972.1 TIGR02099 family protein [Shewanella sp. OMA3-2]